MENLALKMKLVTLWISSVAAQSTASIILFMTPGAIEEIIAGTIMGTEITEGTLVIGALLYWLIPLTMALLSLMLKDPLNRWVNIIVGIVLAVISILVVIGSLTFGQLTLPLINFYKSVVLVLIVWYAWKWPKQKVVTKLKE
jgi:hypothetical protein